MNVATEDSVDAIIASHRVALSKHGTIVPLDTSAHQVVLDSLALEYESYAQLGPALSSFLDLDNTGRSWRITSQVSPDELAELPERLGSSGASARTTTTAVDHLELDEIPDVTRITYAATQPAEPETSHVIASDTGEAIVIPEVIAPIVDASGVAAAETVSAEVAAPAVVVAPTSAAVPSIDDDSAGAHAIGGAAVAPALETGAHAIGGASVAPALETGAHAIGGIVRGDVADAAASADVVSSASIGEVLSEVVAPVAAAETVADTNGIAPGEAVSSASIGEILSGGAPDAAAPFEAASSPSIGEVLSEVVAPVAAAEAVDSDTAVDEAQAENESAPAVGPTPFITAEPDMIDDLDVSEPITAEVPAVVFTDAPVPGDLYKTDAPAAATADGGSDDDDRLDDQHADIAAAAATTPMEEEAADDVESATDAEKAPAFPAALGGSVDKGTFTARQAPVDSPQLVNRVLSSLRSLGSKMDEDDKDSEQDREQDRVETLAEAMLPAPDTAAELTGDTVQATLAVPTGEALAAAAVSTPAPSGQTPVGAVAVPTGEGQASFSTAASARAPAGQASFSTAASAPAPTGQASFSTAASAPAPTGQASFSTAASAPAATGQYSLADISVPEPSGTQTTVTSSAGTVIDVPTASEASTDIPVAYHGVPELLAPSASRPKLSDRLKANQPEASAAASSKRTRRKKR